MWIQREIKSCADNHPRAATRKWEVANVKVCDSEWKLSFKSLWAASCLKWMVWLIHVTQCLIRKKTSRGLFIHSAVMRAQFKIYVHQKGTWGGAMVILSPATPHLVSTHLYVALCKLGIFSPDWRDEISPLHIRYKIETEKPFKYHILLFLCCCPISESEFGALNAKPELQLHYLIASECELQVLLPRRCNVSIHLRISMSCSSGSSKIDVAVRQCRTVNANETPLGGVMDSELT